MRCLNQLFVCLMLLPVAAHADMHPTTGQAATGERAMEVELPLPANPIPIPLLPPGTAKSELVAAYYEVTGGRMFEALMAKFTKPTESMKAKVAGCPAAEAFMAAHYEKQIAPHFRSWLGNSVRPRLIAVLDETFSEAELRAFLRFASTPDGQRHLHQIETQAGKGDISVFPAFLEDPDLRSYHQRFKALSGRVDGVLDGSHAELMTPAFIQQARASGQRIAELVEACNATAKP